MTSPTLDLMATSSSFTDPPLPFPANKEWPSKMQCSMCWSTEQIVQFLNKRQKGGPPVKQCADCRGMVVWKDDNGDFHIDKEFQNENSRPDCWVCQRCARTMPRVNDDAIRIDRTCIHCGFSGLKGFEIPRNTIEDTPLLGITEDEAEDDTEYEVKAITNSYRKGRRLNRLDGKAQLYYTVKWEGYQVLSDLKAEEVLRNAAEVVADFHHSFPDKPRPDNYQPPQGWTKKPWTGLS